MASNTLASVLVLFSVINISLLKEIPDYIHVCKRDPSTIEKCALEAFESLRPSLISGIPELDVPSIDPFFIPELKSLTSDNSPVRAVGYDIKVSGARDVVVKSLSVDLDTFKITVQARFPKMHVEGNYKLDTEFLATQLKGEGTMSADGLKCDVEIVFHSQVTQRDGEEYLKFTKADIDLNMKDYKVHFDGLFNGDKVLGDAANEALNQNRVEILKMIKPILQKTIAKIVLEAANRIVDGLTLNQLLPKP